MTTYYINNETGDNGNNGTSPGTAWQTIGYASLQVGAGDTMELVETATPYPFPDLRADQGRPSGDPNNPITLKAYDGGKPVIREAAVRKAIGLDYWVWDGLTFNNTERYWFEDINGWKFLNCTWEHCHLMQFGYCHRFTNECHDVLYDNCIFDNLRSRTVGQDYTAIYFDEDANANHSGFIVQNCHFRDIGADGIQTEGGGSNSNFLIKDNLFEVIRPYQYRAPVTGAPGPDPDGWINVGENGLDLKAGQNIVVEGNTFRGFRPADGANQDASGASEGCGIIIHKRANHVGHIIRQNWFEDCTGGIFLNGDEAPNSTQEISNNIFYDIKDEVGDFYPTPDDPYSIRVWNYTGACKIEHNSFYNNTPALPQIEIDGATSGNNVTLRNNLFDNGFAFLNNSANPSMAVSNNLWANQSSGPPAAFQGANDVYDDTPGVDYSDFKPQETSAVRGAGIDAGYTQDYYDNPIIDNDIGAVQYVSEGGGGEPRMFNTIALEFTPQSDDMGVIAFWGSYADASNYTKIFHDGTNVVYRRRIGGVNHDALFALSYSAGVTYSIVARLDEELGGDIFVDGAKGTTAPDVSPAQLGGTFSVGNNGNGGEHCYGGVKQLKHWDRALSDGEISG